MKLFIILCLPLLVFSQITFDKTFEGRGYSEGFAVCKTSDGNFIAVAMTRPVGTSTDSLDVFLVKFDTHGELIWSNFYGGKKREWPHAICATADGGCIIAGDTYSWGQNGDFYLLRVNSGGDTVWTQSYGKQSYDVAYGVLQTHDGGFAVAGYTESGDNGNYDVYFIKTDRSGNLKWERHLGEYDSEFGFSVAATADSGFIIAGSQCYSRSTSPGNVLLMKTDSSGTTEWLQDYKGDKDDRANSVKQTTDGGYILAGYTRSFSSGSSNNIYLIRTNADGDTVWTRTIGDITRSEANDVIETEDGEFIVTGFWDGNVALLRVTADGDTVWTRRYGMDSNGHDEGRSVIHTTDGGYIIAGYYNEYPGYLLWLIKTDSEGIVTDVVYPKESPVQDFALYQNYPNPFNPITVIRYEIPMPVESKKLKVKSRVTLCIYNCLGQKVATLVSGYQPPGPHKVEWDASGFVSGVYFYKLSTNQGFSQTRKLILLN